MSERRMFTKKITDGDTFISMPASSQALYFHLCMSADDDGFSNKVQASMFNAHATADDFNVLVAKRFIIPFESGVIVIKHWKMHNLIRNDRYHETKYLEEKAQVVMKDNGVYSLSGIPSDNQMATKRQPSDNQMATEVRIGKDRLSKDSNIKDSSLRSESLSVRKTDYDIIIDLWNELDGLGNIKGIRSIGEGSRRRDNVRARLKQYGIDGFRDAICKIKESDFLQGKHKGKPWAITFDWFILPSNFPKVLEGNYDNTAERQQQHFNIEDWS